MKVFYKLFLSYLSLFLIPILIVMYIAVHSVVASYKDDITEQSIKSAETVANSVDGQLRLSSVMRYALERDVDVLNFESAQFNNYTDKVIVAKTVSNRLYLYSNYQESILSNAVYFSDDDTIIDTTNIYTTEEYYNRYIKDTGVTFEEFKKNINSGSTVYAADSYFVVSQLVRQNNGKNIVSLVMFDSASIINMHTKQAEYTLKSYFIIKDTNSAIIAKSDNFPEDIDAENVQGDVDTVIDDLGNDDVYAVAKDSIVKGLRYYCIFSSEEVDEPINQILLIFVLAMLAMMVIIVLTSYIVSKKLYTPFEAYLQDEGNDDGYNKNITALISDVLMSNTELKNDITERKKYVCNDLLRSFLRNSREMSENSINTMLEDYEITTEYNSFQCAVVKFDENVDISAEKLMLLSSLRNSAKDRAVNYFVLPIQTRDIVLMLNHSLNEKESEKELSDMIILLLKSGRIHARVSLGSVVGSIRKFSKSYEDALICSETSKELIATATEQRKAIESGIYFSKDERQHLKEITIAGDSKAIQSFFGALQRNATKDNIFTTGIMQYLCYALIDLLAEIINNTNIKDSETDKIYSRCQTAISGFDFSKTLQIIKNAYIEIGARITTQKSEYGLELKDKIIDCINNNYSNKDISLRFVSDELHISYNYLCKVFKEQTGEVFLDYLHRIRIDEAKRLLEETDMRIGDIAEQVGYMNANSFIRKFKQVMGITPGEYRISRHN